MDDNIAWKAVLGAALFSLFILGLVYILIAPKESPYFTQEKLEKIAEFKNARVAGRKEGKKSWEFLVGSGWTAPNKDINHLKSLKDGTIYSDGKATLVNLSAPAGKAYQSSQIIELSGRVKTRLDLGRLGNKQNPSRWARLSCDNLIFFPKEKRSELSGKVELYQKDKSLFADRININHENKVADLSGNILVKRRDGTITTNVLTYFSQEESLRATVPLTVKITKGVYTQVQANAGNFYSDINKELTLNGSVEAIQAKKIAIAKEGIYSQARQELLLKGDVKAIFTRAKAMIDENLAEKLHNSETKDSLKKKTVLTADELLFSLRSSDARANGNVFVSQSGKEAKADQADYNDKEDILTLSGNVAIKEKEKWVKAKQVVVSIRHETFTASGSVEAEFRL
jgi:LPS export ABC transporter protein LptC